MQHSTEITAVLSRQPRDSASARKKGLTDRWARRTEQAMPVVRLCRITALIPLILFSSACGTSSSNPTTTRAAIAASTSATTTTVPTSTTTSTTTTAPPVVTADGVAFYPVSAEAVVVTGTAMCWMGGTGPVCEDDMSDPRVSGYEHVGLLRFVVEEPNGKVWVAENDVITGEEGTWRGIAQGAEDTHAIACGEAHFVGEGAYEGLEYHYYFCGWPKAELRGWISDGG
jgi:hypothetical protein